MPKTFTRCPSRIAGEAYEAWRFCLHQPLDDRQRQFVYGYLARVCVRLDRYDEARTWVAKMSGGEQESARRAIERKIAELSKTNAAPPATNSAAVPASDGGGKR